jgi:small GTP-binding protein
VDSQAGLTPADEELARLLRATGKPFVVAANKVDAMSQEANAAAFHRIGAPVFPIAAEHGTGVDDLLDAALAETHDDAENATEEKTPDAVEVAIIGRPNVGKSTLLNRMVGEDRSIVSPIPGTTMDSVDTEVEREGHVYRFVDTAGIRRKAKTTLVAEKLSVVMARRGLERCDVALLIVDGEQGVTQGDAQIASYAEDSGRSVIIVMNKWDLATEAARKASERDAGTTKGKAKLAARATERPRAGARANARISARTVAQSRAQSKTQARGQANRGFSIGGNAGSGGAVGGAAGGAHAFGDLDKSRLLYDYERMVRDKLKFLSYAPIVFLSAKTGDRASKLFPLIDEVAAARKKRISTPELNRWLKEEVDLQRGTTPKARPVRIYYMTQAKTAPPTFLIFTNQKTPLHFSYERFLENQLRKKWDFPGAPIRFVQRLRKREPRPGAPRDDDE